MPGAGKSSVAAALLRATAAGPDPRTVLHLAQARGATRRHALTSGMRLAPVLPVRDVRAALAHYTALGFAGHAYHESDEHGPIYGFLDREGVEVHLARVVELDPRTTTSACYLYVDDADALHASWTAAGVQGRFVPPEDTPYGLREFAHIDPDGNLWRVGSELRREPR